MASCKIRLTIDPGVAPTAFLIPISRVLIFDYNDHDVANADNSGKQGQYTYYPNKTFDTGHQTHYLFVLIFLVVGPEGLIVIGMYNMPLCQEF